MELIQDLNKIKNRIGLVNGTLVINEYDDLEENIRPVQWKVDIYEIFIRKISRKRSKRFTTR